MEDALRGSLAAVGHDTGLLGRLELTEKQRFHTGNSPKIVEALLKDRFVVAADTSCGKRHVLCRVCKWHSQSTGQLRALEHAVHRAQPKPQEVEAWMISHGRTWDEEALKTLRRYRGSGNRTAPCQAPVPDEMLFGLSRAGVGCAKLWLDLGGLKPEQPPEARQVPSQPSMNVREAQKAHVVTSVVLAGTFRGMSHPMSKHFFGMVRGDYKVPGKSTVTHLMAEVERDIEAKLRQRLSAGGPWAITSDGASSKSHSFYNVLVHNVDGDCWLVDMAEANWRKKDAKWLSDLIFRSLAGAQVASVTLDNASVCNAAAKLLIEALKTSSPGAFHIGCQEHSSQLLTADVVGQTPWLQECIQKCNGSMRVLIKRKRAHAFVVDQLPKDKHRKLRTARRTRFNSNADMIDSWLRNRDAIAAATAEYEFKECWQASRKRAASAKEQAAQKALKWWSHAPALERAKRAHRILQPLAIYSRSVAGTSLPAAWPLFLRLKTMLLREYSAADFKDLPRGDTDESKGKRLAGVRDVFVQRESKHVTGSVKAAFAMDARMVKVVPDACVDDQLGYAFGEAWQQAILSMHEVLPNFFPDTTDCGLALQSFEDYVAVRGHFAGIEYPAKNAPLDICKHWFQFKQPSVHLAKLARVFFTAQSSQKSAEQAWAVLSRQVQPIRARMRGATTKTVTSVAWNYSLAYPSAGRATAAHKHSPHHAVDATELELSDGALSAESDSESSSASSSSTSSSSAD